MQIYNSTRTQTGMKQNGKSTEFESCNFDDGNDDLSNWRFPQLLTTSWQTFMLDNEEEEKI